jgi:hypothetical protein
METYQRTREQGTVETLPGNGPDRIQAIRRIVEEKQYAKIDGQMIDLFSASAIVKTFDALSPENQSKYSAIPAPTMAKIAFKLMK